MVVVVLLGRTRIGVLGASRTAGTIRSRPIAYRIGHFRGVFWGGKPAKPTASTSFMERTMGSNPRPKLRMILGILFPFSPHRQKRMIAHAATSNRKSMQRLLGSILAPGTFCFSFAFTGAYVLAEPLVQIR